MYTRYWVVIHPTVYPISAIRTLVVIFTTRTTNVTCRLEIVCWRWCLMTKQKFIPARETLGPWHRRRDAPPLALSYDSTLAHFRHWTYGISSLLEAGRSMIFSWPVSFRAVWLFNSDKTFPWVVFRRVALKRLINSVAYFSLYFFYRQTTGHFHWFDYSLRYYAYLFSQLCTCKHWRDEARISSSHRGDAITG